jgi:hypothetical protein
MFADNKGIVTVKVEMLPSDRRDVFEKGQCFWSVWSFDTKFEAAAQARNLVQVRS